MKRKAVISLLILLVILITGCSSKGSRNKVSDTSRSSANSTPILQAGDSTKKSATPIPEEEFGYDFDSTWGDLIVSEGGMVYETLTRAQQALVHYPRLNSNKVCWVKNGKSYHAIDWCYTLSRSKNIQNGTLAEALGRNMEPCSKCVGE